MRSVLVTQFGLSPDSSAPKSWILVAVPPTIHCTLNETPFPTKTRIQLCKSPSYLVAVGLVVQTVAFVLIPWHTCSRIDTII